MDMEKMHLRSYGKGELALLYNPHLTASAARKKLSAWMAFHPTLMDSLLRTGYDPSRRCFTPRQVELIVEALGEP